MISKLLLLGLTRDAARHAATLHLRDGAGVAAAVHRAAHRTGRFEPEQHGLGPRGIAAWRETFELSDARIDRVHGEDIDDVAKAIVRLHDGLEVETVRIPMGDRGESQCLSSQVGCAMGCRFCETGLLGRLRDLRADEIVAQVVLARRELGWRPRNLVFQGMGEPLDALDSVVDAIDILTDRNGLSFARDRITVCTAGHVDGIRRLFANDVGRLNLSLSLTVADETRRAELMPIARRWSLAELQGALVEVRPRGNWQLGVHVCLMPDINDSRDDARAIARFCAPLGRVMVHLIPYNPGSEPLSRAPTEPEIERMVGWLRDEGLPVRRRITKGRDLKAACGQLGNLALRRPRRTRGKVFPDQDSNLD
ncbi:MAG: radical SAM protein [Planctomycetota bacterium]